VRRKYLGPIYLPTDLYERLERLAAAHERDPLQHARWLLRHAITAPESGTGRPASLDPTCPQDEQQEAISDPS
jgi:hypothetical protein